MGEQTNPGRVSLARIFHQTGNYANISIPNYHYG